MASIGDVDRNVTITFIGRDNASRAMGSIGNSASRTSRIVGGLVKVLKYAAIAAAAALAAGALIAAKALWDATKAAYADDLAMKKLAETQMRAQDATKAQTKATADYIDKMELATGIADDDLRPAMENLALTGMSLEQSHQQLSLAADIAIAKNVSLTSASAALAKAYNGQMTGLSRLGIKVTKANGDALTFAETQKLLRERFKGAAKAAGRTDPLKRLTAAYNQMKEKVGGALLPMLRQFSTWMIEVAVPWIKGKLVPWVRTAARWLGENLPKAADALRKWWDTSGKKSFTDLWNKLKDLGSSVGSLTSAILGGGGGGALDGHPTTRTASGGAVGAVETLGAGFDSLAGFLAPVVNLLQAIIDKLEYIQSLDPFGSIADWVGGDNPLDGPPDDYDPGWKPSSWSPWAKGGWIKRAMGGPTSGSWALVGEHGPELINNRGFIRPHSASMGGVGGGNIIVNVHGAIDPVGTARQIRQILAKGDRASGRGALGLA